MQLYCTTLYQFQNRLSKTIIFVLWSSLQPCFTRQLSLRWNCTKLSSFEAWIFTEFLRHIPCLTLRVRDPNSTLMPIKMQNLSLVILWKNTTILPKQALNEEKSHRVSQNPKTFFFILQEKRHCHRRDTFSKKTLWLLESNSDQFKLTKSVKLWVLNPYFIRNVIKSSEEKKCPPHGQKRCCPIRKGRQDLKKIKWAALALFIQIQWKSKPSHQILFWSAQRSKASLTSSPCWISSKSSFPWTPKLLKYLSCPKRTLWSSIYHK